MSSPNSTPKSLNNDVPSYANFFNRSDRSVDLFWIDYNGKLVRYGRIPPYRGTAMNTYVTHPWIVRDAYTGYPLLLNGKGVFHPSADTFEERRALVWIHIPVYSLLRRSMEVIFIHFDVETVRKWDMPASLKDLLNNLSPLTDFGNYKGFDNVHYYDLHRLDHGDQDDDDGNDNADADNGNGNDDDNNHL